MVKGARDFVTPIVQIETLTVEGSVNIVDTVTIQGTVSISGTVTVEGEVEVSGPVTISTVAADNIIIDKLTVGAYTERRSTIANPALASPPHFYTDRYRGKFFPRGARGFIYEVQTRARNTSASDATINFAISPFPGMGRFLTFSITVPAGEDGSTTLTATLRKYWNYDSMFIYTETPMTSNVGIGYDAVEPFDHFLSDDLVTWTPISNRPYISVDMSGQTVGDVPVSGTINTIEIPVASSSASQVWVNIPADEEVSLIILHGAGQLEHGFFISNYENMYFNIFCDDEVATWFSWAFLDIYGVGASTPELQKLKGPDPAGNYYTSCNMKLKWKRVLEVTAYNPHASETYRAMINRLTYTKTVE